MNCILCLKNNKLTLSQLSYKLFRMPQLVSLQRPGSLTSSDLSFVNSTGFQFVSTSSTSWLWWSASVCMDCCLHIWLLTVYLWRQWPADDISSLLCPAGLNTSLGTWNCMVAGAKIWNSRGANSHAIVADIRMEAKALFVYVLWAHLRVFIYLCATNVLSIIRLHRMHEMQHIVPMCAVSVSLSVCLCHVAQLGFTVQKRLNGSKCCFGWTL